MSKSKVVTPTGNTRERQRSIARARANFNKLNETIAPFLKKKVTKVYSTEGEWCDASSFLCLEDQST